MKDVPENELLSAYLDGELTAGEQAEVERLLAASPAARQLVEELRALSSTLQSLPRQELGEDLSESVLRQAEREILTESAPRPAPAAVSPRSIIRGMLSRRAIVWSALAVGVALVIMVVEQREEDLRGGREIVAKRDKSAEQPALPAIRTLVPTEEEAPALKADLASSPAEVAAPQKPPALEPEAAHFAKGGPAPPSTPVGGGVSKWGTIDESSREKAARPPQPGAPVLTNGAGEKLDSLAKEGAEHQLKAAAGAGKGGQLAPGPAPIANYQRGMRVGGMGRMGVDAKQGEAAGTEDASKLAGKVAPAQRQRLLARVTDDVVVLQVSPEAIRQNAFNAVLSANSIDCGTTAARSGAEDEARALALNSFGEFRRQQTQVARQQTPDGRQAADWYDMGAGQTYLVLVEATPGQIRNTLADLADETRHGGQLALSSTQVAEGRDGDRLETAADLTQEKDKLADAERPQRGNAWMFLLGDESNAQAQPAYDYYHQRQLGPAKAGEGGAALGARGGTMAITPPPAVEQKSESATVAEQPAAKEPSPAKLQELRVPADRPVQEATKPAPPAPESPATAPPAAKSAEVAPPGRESPKAAPPAAGYLAPAVSAPAAPTQPPLKPGQVQGPQGVAAPQKAASLEYGGAQQRASGLQRADRAKSQRLAAPAPAAVEGLSQKAEVLKEEEAVELQLRRGPTQQQRRYVLFVLQVGPSTVPAASAPAQQQPSVPAANSSPANEPGPSQ